MNDNPLEKITRINCNIISHESVNVETEAKVLKEGIIEPVIEDFTIGNESNMSADKLEKVDASSEDTEPSIEKFICNTVDLINNVGNPNQILESVVLDNNQNNLEENHRETEDPQDIVEIVDENKKSGTITILEDGDQNTVEFTTSNTVEIKGILKEPKGETEMSSHFNELNVLDIKHINDVKEVNLNANKNDQEKRDFMLGYSMDSSNSFIDNINDGDGALAATEEMSSVVETQVTFNNSFKGPEKNLSEQKKKISFQNQLHICSLDMHAEGEYVEMHKARQNYHEDSTESSSLDIDIEYDSETKGQHHDNTNANNDNRNHGAFMPETLDEISLANYYNGSVINFPQEQDEKENPKAFVLSENSWFHQEFAQFGKAENVAQEVRPLSPSEAWEKAKEAKYFPTAEEMNRSLPDQEEQRTKLFARVRPSYNIGEILQNYDFDDQRTHELFGLKSRPPSSSFPRHQKNNDKISGLAARGQAIDNFDMPGPRFRSTGCSTADIDECVARLPTRNRLMPSPPQTPKIKAGSRPNPLPPITGSETDSSSESDSSWGEAPLGLYSPQRMDNESQPEKEVILSSEEIWIR
jgi:hypothetical protein